MKEGIDGGKKENNIGRQEGREKRILTFKQHYFNFSERQLMGDLILSMLATCGRIRTNLSQEHR